jgi:hypothetical protein
MIMDETTAKVFGSEAAQTNFVCFHLADWLRSELDDGTEPGNYHSALFYDHSYEDIHVFVEVMDDPLYWVYIKDYNFGHMKPLGECIYDYKVPGTPEMPESYNGIEYIPGRWSHFGDDKEDSEENNWKSEDNHPRDEEYEAAYAKAYWDRMGSKDYLARANEAVLPDLARRILSGEINIRQELHDYYHVIPDEGIPRINERMRELMSVQDAAAALGVTASRVKKMVADGVIDGFKRDGKLYLAKEGVEARKLFIEQFGKPTRGKAKKGDNNG